MSTLRQDEASGKLSPDASGTGSAGVGAGSAGLGGGSAGGGGGGSAGRSTGVGVLDRSVALLDLLADGPRTLRWLSGASGLPRPTAYRLLVALEAHRLIARDSSGAFGLGPRLTELAVRAGPAVDLAALAGPVLTRLHEATGESVQLYVRSGDRRLCIAARDAGTGLRDSVPVGALLPLDAGSGGKVLLAWSQAADTVGAGAVPGGIQPAGTVPGAVQPGAVQPGAVQPGGVRPAGTLPGGIRPAELAAVRKRGWAASVAERESGVASVSAPVLADGVLLGALCISGPASRIGTAPGKRLAPMIVEAAAGLAALAAKP
jgi:DNA-binding IclR family transcriptional regulator